MAVPDPVAAFIAQANSHGDTVVRDLPRLDLDLYIQNYSGRTRFDRLLFIGKTCLPLCLDALKAALAEAKAGSDVARYGEAWDCIRIAAPDSPEAVRDDGWIQATETANKVETARLEAELRGYKNNLIKESIRMGHEDLGKHLEDIGKLAEASEAYSRMRQDASTTKHIVECGMHLANVSLQRGEWAMVLANVGKMAGALSSEDEDKGLQACTSILSGIALLSMGRYADAAHSFLHTDSSAPPAQYNHIASPNDVALYGALAALATMDRRELQQHVLDSSSFRTFLEHEPHIRKAISLFVNGRYTNCLSILESARADSILDLYLHNHVSALYSRIRSKCIVQYLAPFSNATLVSLDAAFGWPGHSIESEIVDMIRAGSLRARIDAKDRLLVAERPDARLSMQKEALQVARSYEQEAKERLRRINLMAAGLEVVGSRKLPPEQAPTVSLDEAWYDEGGTPTLTSSDPIEEET